MKAVKSIRQQIQTNQDLNEMMEIFRQMVNDCIRIGLENNCSTLKKLSLLSYHKLDDYQIHSSYKLNAISQACGRLSQMRRSMRRGITTKSPYVKKPHLVNCYGFKVNGMLMSIPYKARQPINILLNEHTQKTLLDKSLKVRSFSMNESSISLCITKEVEKIECENVVGIDRNLRNVTVGNKEKVTIYDVSKLVQIKENMTHVLSTFKRNDVRIRRRLSHRLGKRQQNRVNHILHKISKDVVQKAKETRSAIIFENLRGIRKLYKKGNGQGNKFRRRMNTWSFYEFQRQVEYKSRWEGIPVKFVDPKCTSQVCPRCGKRLQEDRQRPRELWCGNCQKWMDRDVIASMNISCKGWTRFIHPQDVAGEAMMQESKLSNYDDLVILKVDATKLRVKKC